LIKLTNVGQHALLFDDDEEEEEKDLVALL